MYTRNQLLQALGRYWPREAAAVEALPIPKCIKPLTESLPPRLTAIEMPDWAVHAAVDRVLLVPAAAVVDGPARPWERTDWWHAAGWYLHGTAEREHERQYGSIHSFAFRLKGWDERMWSRAWVNRIALFLRAWAARAQSRAEVDVFGALPDAELVLSHDVDAVRKTAAIRIKQGAFQLYNALRAMAAFAPGQATDKLRSAGRFFFAADDYWKFEAIEVLEEKYGVRSHFNFYAGLGGGQRRSWRAPLMDPGYDVHNPAIVRVLKRLQAGGWTVGLHPSYDDWHDAGPLARQKQYLERALGSPVSSLRQHWLRFGWGKTWDAQQQAGFLLDTTLGFNDRPGFRNGAALRWHPLDTGTGEPMRIEALPTMLMDSQVYDYWNLSTLRRREEIQRWVTELSDVRGVASVIWHPQAFSRDYGWGSGYNELLEIWFHQNR